MNKLECQVTTCQHYCDNLCCLPGIQVEGPAAQKSDQTCCNSYEEIHEGWENSAYSHDPSVDSAIDCKAKNCVYNNDCKCEAECVCVGCCCGNVTAKSETECCTFKEI